VNSIIFTHGDCDGICSGAIALCALKDAEIFFTSPVGLFDDLGAVKHFENVVICDIAMDERFFHELCGRLDALSKRLNLTYIDHHPLPKGIERDWLHHDEGACASELTYIFFENLLDKDMRRVAMYGAIGDFCDGTPRVINWLKDWDKRSLYFEAGVIIQGIEEARRDYDFKRQIVRSLSNDAIPSANACLLEKAKTASGYEEDLRLRVKKRVKQMKNIGYVVDIDGYMSKAAIYAAAYGNALVGISAEHRADKRVYDLSIRSRDKVDLNKILRTVAIRHGGSGGGHVHAGGARIPEKRLDEFLHDLDETIEEG